MGPLARLPAHSALRHLAANGHVPAPAFPPSVAMARKAARVREIAGLKALSFAQSDRHGSHVGAALWPYRDRLPFTLDPHVETGREAGASHIRHDLRTAGAAGNVSRHTADRVGPGAGKRAAIGDDIAADFRPVAVARAAQSLLNRLAGGINRIGRLAANPFGGAIRHGDGAGTRPVAGQADERSFGTGLRLGLRRNKQNSRRDYCFFEAASRGIQRKNGHEFTFPIPLPRSQSCRGPAIMATLPRVAMQMRWSS